MTIKWVFGFLLALTAAFSDAQQTLFGTNQYVEYQIGELPLVLSVAHGGNMEPMDIPDRTCNNAVTVTDAYTLETALAMKESLIALTGCSPHLVICHLSRKKLDCNRNIADGACGDPQAELAWTEFHDFIASARNAANMAYNGNTFFVDVHGHGNPIDRIELGYLLYDDELELSDNTLNSATYVNYSSIQELVASNLNGYSHVELLRGPQAFGTLLSNHGFPSVPSEQIPFPGLNTNYYSGGYITANHTCYNSSAQINGFQMELNYNGIRNNQSNRTLFAQGFSEAFTAFMTTHFDMNWGNCAFSGTESNLPMDVTIFPNAISQGDIPEVQNNSSTPLLLSVFDPSGKRIYQQVIPPMSTTKIPFQRESGCYIFQFSTKEGYWNDSRKVMVLN
jgi:N-formylglutamate amidohydrolase